MTVTGAEMKGERAMPIKRLPRARGPAWTGSFCLVAAAILFGQAACWAAAPWPSAEPPPAPPPFAKWGSEALAQIEKDLRLQGSDLYAEYGTPDGKRGSDFGGPSFIWPASFQLRALAAAAKVSPAQYRAALIRYADALNRHWGVRDGSGGYMVLPSKSERFYDDNAWMVLGMIDTFEATGQRKYLIRAAETLAFIAGGEKKTAGGGVRQHEDKPGGPFTCTTAPAAVGALRLYLVTRDPNLLAMADRWYAWLTSKEVGIQDPADGLYHQWAVLENGKWRVCLGKRAYQSALPLEVNLLLYQVRKDSKYLAEAQRIAASAVAHWVKPSGGLQDTGQWGGSDLSDALLDLYVVDKDPRWLESIRTILRFLHEKGRDPNGRYGEYWHEDRKKPLDKFHLLYMAPAARAYWHAAAVDTGGPPRPGGP